MEAGTGGRSVTRVTYLPISHTPPRAGEHAIAIPPRIARHLDLAPRPGPGRRFDYGPIPPKLFAAVAQRFAALLSARPRLLHRRDG